MAFQVQPKTSCNLNSFSGDLRCPFGELSRQGHTPQTYIAHGLCTGKIAGLLAVVATSRSSSTDPFALRRVRDARDASAGWARHSMRDGTDTHHGRPLRRDDVDANRLDKREGNLARQPLVAPIKTYLTPELANYVFHDARAEATVRGRRDCRPA